ncbi:MAG: hypothetical protein OXR66_03385 [Candidatus Woesearchaeota archaeon]|nr:hypothetical protein [Candidatus Woesearchaeota archaeon]
MNKQTIFVWFLTIISVAAVGFTYFMTIDQYTHEPIPEDCTKPYEYPMCERAVQPDPLPPPSSSAFLLGTAFMVFASILFVCFAFMASVTEQKNLVVGDVTAGRDLPKHDLGKPGHSHTPQTIARNDVPKDAVEPLVTPKKGVKNG